MASSSISKTLVKNPKYLSFLTVITNYYDFQLSKAGEKFGHKVS